MAAAFQPNADAAAASADGEPSANGHAAGEDDGSDDAQSNDTARGPRKASGDSGASDAASGRRATSARKASAGAKRAVAAVVGTRRAEDGKGPGDAPVKAVRYIVHKPRQPFEPRNYPLGVESIDLHELAYDAFYSRYLAGRCPVVLRGFDPDWCARARERVCACLF